MISAVPYKYKSWRDMEKQKIREEAERNIELCLSFRAKSNWWRQQ
jgi:hypothetical protein